MRKKATAISLLDCGAADAGDSARPPATSSVQKAKDFKGIRIRNDSSQDTGWRFASLQIKDGVPAHFRQRPRKSGVKTTMARHWAGRLRSGRAARTERISIRR